MALNSVTPSISPQSALSGSRSTMADNFDQFLSILTTQLKNQNPLDPLDTNQFTQQLVQFSGVEQQLKTNQYLEALLMVNSSSQAASNQAMALIGKDVTVATNAGELKNGTANWMFTSPDKADAAKITIKDARGNVVYTGTKNIVPGENRFTWNGKANDGSDKTSGVYSISVDALDYAGKPVSISTQMTARVDGVDMTGAEPYLIVGSARIAMGSILSVRTPGAAS